MKKPNRLLILIFFLATISAILIVWRLFIYQPLLTTPSIPMPTPTPTSSFIYPSLTPTNQIQEKGESPADLLKSLKKRFPLIESLPYETPDFHIDYKAPLTLLVKLKTATASPEIKQQVTDWILSKGVDPATHKIEYLTPVP